MARSDVRDFMCHYACQFCFVPCRKQKPLIDIKKSAGKCEGIDFVSIDNFDLEGNLCIRVLNDILANTVNILRDHGIINEASRLLKFGCDLSTQSYFFFEGDEIGQDSEDSS
jgi:hypothetical protein